MTEVRAQEGQAAITAGALLRRAREAEGLHVAALAASLKVPVRKLEALEADRYELLTDTVFLRALASSVCRTLKIDPQPVLERLPQTVMPRLLGDSDGINATFRVPSEGLPRTWRQWLSRPVYLAVLALLLGALVLMLLPNFQTDTAAPQVAATRPTEPQAPATSQPTGEAVSTVLSPAIPAAAADAASTAAASGGAAAPAGPTVEPAMPAGPGTAATGILVFRTNGPSWVEVTDAMGVVAVRKLLTAGEQAGVSGVPPLKVTIGRVDYTEVDVRGKPFDLKPVSRDNVARFEVK